jgi:hypothetical protein
MRFSMCGPAAQSLQRTTGNEKARQEGSKYGGSTVTASAVDSGDTTMSETGGEK